MSRVCLPSRAFNDRRIKGSHLRVLAAVAMLGEGQISHRQIGAECGVVERDLRRELRELSDFGYLTITPVEGFVSLYRVAYEPLESGDKTPGETGEETPSGDKSPPGINSPPGEKINTHASNGVSPPAPPFPFPQTPNPNPPITPPSPATKRARACRLPDAWLPSAANIAYAEARGFVGDMLSRQIEDFRDYWHARAGPNALKLDWSKTWATWIRKAADWRARANERNGDGRSHARAVDILRDAALDHDERQGGRGYPETAH